MEENLVNIKEDIFRINQKFNACFDYDGLYTIYNILHECLINTKFTKDWRCAGDSVDIIRIQIAKVLGRIQHQTKWELLKVSSNNPDRYFLISMNSKYPQCTYYPVFISDENLLSTTH